MNTEQLQDWTEWSEALIQLLATWFLPALFVAAMLGMFLLIIKLARADDSDDWP